MVQLPYAMITRRLTHPRLWLCAGLAFLMFWQMDRMRSVAPMTDFLAYWSGARVLVSGGNPYSSAQMLQTQAAAGWKESDTLHMWNPPWTLTFFVPLAVFSYGTGYMVFLVFNLVILLLCGGITWRVMGGKATEQRVAWFVATSFFPALATLGFGQMGALLLFGIVLFLRYCDSRPLLAGAATVLIALKPQLPYLFWISLLFWALQHRCWRVLAGMAGALATAALVPSILRPQIWSEYLEFARSGAMLGYPSPTLGTLLRLCFGGDRDWLQFVPSVAGTAWFLLYWRSRRFTWDWKGQLPILLMVSVATTPYGWLFDQMVLLPALIEIAASVSARSSPGSSRLIAVYAALNLGIVLSVALKVTGAAYAWTAPAWLLAYLFAKWQIAPAVQVDTAAAAAT